MVTKDFYRMNDFSIEMITWLNVATLYSSLNLVIQLNVGIVSVSQQFGEWIDYHCWNASTFDDRLINVVHQ